MITTINHNVGDDFVREGILYLLKEKYSNITVRPIHKHIPVTVRDQFEWVYNSGFTKFLDRIPKLRGLRLSKLIDLLPIQESGDKILQSDLLIQSGAPVYWCHPNNHCANNEWYNPLVKKRYLRIADRVPFLNLAAGTCQRYDSDGSEFLACPRCSIYIKELHELTTVTTVRDNLARKILNNLGLDPPVIPCSSIFAKDYFGISAGEPEFFCLNYMEGGGHYDFNQHIDSSRWESIFREFYGIIKDKYNNKCIFVCHNKKEIGDARKIDPKSNIFYSTKCEDYLKFYARCKLGIMNRVHGAFAIASFGRPSFIVGTDTRARMVEEISLKHAFVNDITVEQLLQEFDWLIMYSEDYQERFREIKNNAYKAYLDVLDRI